MESQRKNYHTRQQEAVLDYFRQNPGGCVTVDEIYIYFLSCGCKIGKSTIYRCLERMVENGTVQKFISDSGESAMFKQIDADRGCDRHFHMKCTECGAIIHMDCEFMEEFEQHMRRHHGFTVDNSRTVIYGLCEKCRIGKE